MTSYEDDGDFRISLKTAAAVFKVEAALGVMDLALRAYDPNQPRWPMGTSDGGQWRPSAGTGSRIDFAGRFDAKRAAICDQQQILDYELCRTAGSALCWGLAASRWAACMKNDYVPTLRF